LSSQTSASKPVRATTIIAEALKTDPDALLPTRSLRAPNSWVAGKLPPGTNKAIAEWAAKVVEKK
jgi:hypothetical protein